MKNPLDDKAIISHKNKLAFSLIEISVVILVIGILIAGISKGMDLYQDFKLTTAKNLTMNSRVVRMDGLTLWLDTTDDSNLKTSLVANINTTQFGKIQDSNPISAWRDRDSKSVNKITTVASTDDKRPTYVSNGINGLPSLKFEYSLAQTLSSFTTPLRGGQTEYTIVAIFQKELQGGAEYVVSQATINSPVPAGLQGSIYIYGGIIFNGSGANFTSSTPYVAKKDYFVIAKINNNLANNVAMYVNKITPDIGVTSPGGPSALNLSNEVLSIGSRSNGMLAFKGLISEVIIFERAITDSEIKDIIEYLSKKYNIKLS